MVLKSQDISKFEMDEGEGYGCVLIYMDVCSLLVSVFQITLRCVVLNSQDVSEFDVDEGGLFVNDIYLQGADWDFQHDRLTDSK